MILVDTSVWIDHLHQAEPRLVEGLGSDEVGCHSLVVQELALGSIKSRDRVLALLQSLHTFPLLSGPEVLTLVSHHRLWGRGLSSVDAHLLGTVRLVSGAQLWTRDKRLRAAAGSIGVECVAE